jgi:gliding motility-associated-like protein
MWKQVISITIIIFLAENLFAQTCTNVGQTPESAFPVCGNEAFTQTNVPICGNINVPVPCFDGASYQNKNPFWYKFSCYSTGSIGFIITPTDATDDYDWQLFDATGHNPSDVFTDATMFVSCNWSGEPGETGSSSAGNGTVVCSGFNQPTFSSMATIYAGHEYLLLVSHFTNSQSGYQLVFDGGSAVITDPVLPALINVRPSCDGTALIVKTNKKVKCISIASNGSDFMLNGPATITGAFTPACGSHFDTDSIILTLSNPIPIGNYTLTVQDGTDGNTLLDNCNRPIDPGNSVQFSVSPAAPTPMDSMATFPCATNKLQLIFRRPIRCNTVVPTDFTVTGPQPVSVTGIGSCGNINLGFVITLNLSAPLLAGGLYQVHLQTGTDGNTIIDECGNQTPVSTLNFTVNPKPSADFTYPMRAGCRNDTITFSHNGNNGTNSWNWTFDNTITNTQQNAVQVYSASSQHVVKLIVSNGACKDTITKTIILDNKVVAEFETANIICPEDSALILNRTNGNVDSWSWIFGNGATSNLKDPTPAHYPPNGRESIYTIKLIAANTSLGCSDSLSHVIKVLSSCFIAVPSAFTPNGDGLNDYLYPINALKADGLEFKVFNRWGQLLFATKDWQRKWDGKTNGVAQAAGTYVWFLSFTHHDTGKKVFMKGITILIR